MARRGKLERQRERIVDLLRADPSRSLRSIAKEVGCGTSTVSRTRDRYVTQDADDGTARTRRPGSENLIAPADPATTGRCDTAPTRRRAANRSKTCTATACAWPTRARLMT